MELIVGIDPGVNFTGVVIFSRMYDAFGIVKVHLIKRIHRDLGANLQKQCIELRRLFLDLKLPDDVHSCPVIMELPRVYPQSRVRPNDLIDLTFMAGGLCRATPHYPGYKIVTVYPKTWKGTVPKKQHNARILKKLPGFEDKLTAIPKGQREHLIDAAGLGLWYIERNK